MARVSRQSFEGWPGWSKLGFLLVGILMIVLGILFIVRDKHIGGAILGIANIVLALPFLYGFLFNPRWNNDPEGYEVLS